MQGREGVLRRPGAGIHERPDAVFSEVHEEAGADGVRLTHIDLFSGIGGFALAAWWAGFETVAFVEIEPYAQEIIKQNFGAVENTDAGDAERGQGERPAIRCSKNCEGTNDYIGRRSAKLFSDIRTFDGTAYRGATLLTGGFPCQPFSQAGKRRGAADDRALWSEMFRVIQEARPAWVLGENVAGIVTMELDRVLSDLEGEGYAVQPLVIPACAVDAKHRRDRVWIVGHTDGSGFEQQWRAEPVRAERWEPEPPFCRVANGVPRRVDRLKGLGNAIVPQAAYEILRVIAKIESDP